MDGQDILRSLGDASDETEFYTPMPAGYRTGQTKYVFVFGTVMSGLGKGIFSSSLAKVFQDKGLTVAPIKLEGYFNRDSGTLNPYRHGEVFVLDDGMECDMDLGTYERMLDQDLTNLNFTTSGQIFSTVLEKERAGGYLGRDVQMIPHVTGEVKNRLRELAVVSRAQVIFVEIGGTVGDVENAYYIEAIRQLSYEEGPHSCCFVALTYILEPSTLGEQKSKPAQMNLKQLNAMGIHPHIIACRAQRPVTRKVREKLALYSNVPMERVFSMHDCDSVYVVPESLRGAGIDTAVVELLQLEDRVDREAEAAARSVWNDYISRFRQAACSVTVGIIGKYTTLRDSYASVIQALEHAGTALGARVSLEWIDSAELTDANVAERLRCLDAVIVPGGFGTRGVDGKIAALQHVRTQGVPYLGLCYGFQMAVIEFARNVCGLTEANSTEIDADTPYPVIDILPGQECIEGVGASMRLGGQELMIEPDTLLYHVFGDRKQYRLRFRHRYEANPIFVERLEAGGLVFSGRSPEQPIANQPDNRQRIMQALELPADMHPFFLATQAHPELTSRPLSPSPMFVALVRAALARRGQEPTIPAVDPPATVCAPADECGTGL